MKTVILAAGKGTRLKEYTRNRPKPMVTVRNKQSILEIMFQGLREAGMDEIVVVTGYHANLIEEAYGDGSSLKLHVRYVRQQELNGTGSALLLTQPYVEKVPILMTFGDILIPPSHYRKLVDDYNIKPEPAILSVNAVDDPSAGAAVYFDEPSLHIRDIIEKPPKGASTTGWNNAGVMVLEPVIFDYLKRLEPSPRGEYELTDAVRQMIGDGHQVRALPIDGFWRDIGTPDDVDFVRQQLDVDPRLLERTRMELS